jgi:hypothetical protein
MQNYIIRYVETLKARIEPTGCSINAALIVELPQMDRRQLLKLREAADDLHRIIDLELGRRQDVVDANAAAYRQGIKHTGDAGGISWALYRPEISDDAIRAAWGEFEGYDSGPGRQFARRACIRRTATRVLVTQFAGLDV